MCKIPSRAAETVEAWWRWPDVHWRKCGAGRGEGDPVSAGGGCGGCDGGSGDIELATQLLDNNVIIIIIRYH